MSIELVYRMRTCAAALADGHAVPSTELADILVEASNLLDVAEPVGELMAILSDGQSAANSKPVATWGGDLPAAVPQPCPSCGSIDARSVKRNGRRLMLTCPRCQNTWEYGKHGAT